MTITLEMNPQGQPYNTLEELTNGGRCICHIIERRTGRQKHQQIVRSLNSTLNKRPKEKILCNNPQNSSKQFCIHNLWLHDLSVVPHLFWHQGLVPWKTVFPQVGVGAGVVSGWFKHITLIVCFISIMITSAPPRIVRRLFDPGGWGLLG